MAGVNRVIIVGNLGADPEVRYMPSGGAVASIRVATSENWKDAKTGERQERTEWHSITLFNRLGEVAGEYLRKGSKVYVEGSLRTEKWQDQSGNDRYTTKIIASSMQMLDAKGGSAGSGSMSQSAPASQGAPERSSAPQAQAPQEQAAFDDDIPF